MKRDIPDIRAQLSKAVARHGLREARDRAWASTQQAWDLAYRMRSEAPRAEMSPHLWKMGAGTTSLRGVTIKVDPDGTEHHEIRKYSWDGTYYRVVQRYTHNPRTGTGKITYMG